MVRACGRDCRGEARLARRVRSTRIVIILYIYHPHLFCGRGMPRPYKALQRQGYKHYLLPLRGAHVLHILRLFIPKHHLSVMACAAHTYCDYSLYLFCGRGVPRPYIALLPQGYRGDYCPYRGHTYYDYSFSNIIVGYCGRGVTHTYRSLTGEACLAPTFCVFSLVSPTSYFQLRTLRGSACVLIPSSQSIVLQCA